MDLIKAIRSDNEKQFILFILAGKEGHSINGVRVIIRVEFMVIDHKMRIVSDCHFD